MSERVVKTQAELDAAITDGVAWIEIRSERGVWIEVRNNGSSSVRACDSSSVTAYDSSSVTACGSSSVRACDSSSVTACGSSSVRACDSSSVTASSHVAVHLHSGHVQLDGGVLIDHTAVDQSNAATWCDYHGVTVVDGIATVYKAVDDHWTTPRNTNYSPGTLPSCDDFVADGECGGGLHFGPTPAHALAYHAEATKFLAVGVRVDELNPVVGSLGTTAKCKAPRVVTPCIEVDINGKPIASADAA